MAMDVDTGARFSAFGGLINTPVYTLLDSIPLYGLDAELFGTDTQGSGSVTDDLNNSATELTVTSGAGADVLTIVGIRRTASPDVVASLVWDEVR